jgi:phenylalanyl-tRNA synthetase beta chain
LADDAPIGKEASEYLQPYADIIYQIGLTPNRMDAMSHWGVARDVCSYLTHHDKKEARAILPVITFKRDTTECKIKVTIEDSLACPRYSGLCLSSLRVDESPKWLQERLKSIGLRPINNLVDITNFIQHETGQPLHAFDLAAIKGNQIIVKKMPQGTRFRTLDEKVRELANEDLMICNAEEAMCIAGVFGGHKSGVTADTRNIFLESACFDPATIRKTSFRHGLRTDAASRFEKGIDISNTVNVLKRAALLIKEIAGGKISSDIIDIYPNPQPKKQVTLKYQYLKKLSGKIYHPQKVNSILQSLGFIIIKDGLDVLTVEVPYHKPDINLPADIVEEIIRIDGLDHIEIPSAITITPSFEEDYKREGIKEKIAQVLTGAGFSEILTNSITNSAYLNQQQLSKTVRLVNNLSTELDVLRPAMLPTALEVIVFNCNRKNNNLKLFEFGKTYETETREACKEIEHLCLYITGNIINQNWKGKAVAADIYYLKGIVEAILTLFEANVVFREESTPDFNEMLTASIGEEIVVRLGKVVPGSTQKPELKQSVFFANFNWDSLVKLTIKLHKKAEEVAKFPFVERDLAMIVSKEVKFEEAKNNILNLKLNTLRDVKLFDVFTSDKLGPDNKSLAINFTFLDREKTLTDKEIDVWMNTIMTSLEKGLGAEIRKQ